MKVLQSSIFRAVCSIIIGVLLIKYPENTVTGITIFIGVLFFLPGLFSIITYFNAKKHPEEVYDVQGNLIAGGKPTIPIVGAGSILLGLLLALTPDLFVKSLMYVLGAILVLGAINQYVSLINIRKIGNVAWQFFIVPTIILLTGLFVIFYPNLSAGIPLIIIGWCCLVYGITEFINAIKIHSINKVAAKESSQQNMEQKETQQEEQ